MLCDDDFALSDKPTGLLYDKACRVTCESDDGAGEVEGGVVTRTAYGDGQYPVYALMSGNRTLSVTIYFDEDPNEPRYDFCEETEEHVVAMTRRATIYPTYVRNPLLADVHHDIDVVQTYVAVDTRGTRVRLLRATLLLLLYCRKKN